VEFKVDIKVQGVGYKMFSWDIKVQGGIFGFFRSKLTGPPFLSPAKKNQDCQKFFLLPYTGNKTTVLFPS